MNESEHRKLGALLFIQFLGLVAVAVLSYIGGRLCYQYSSEVVFPYLNSITGPFVSLLPAFVVTFLILVFTGIGSTGTLNAGRWCWNKLRSLRGGDHYVPRKLIDKKWHLGLKSTANFIVCMDIVGAGYCVKSTGGAEASIFTPFLLIIPTIVVLLEIYQVSRILAWGFFCLAVFAWSIVPFPGFSDSNQTCHHFLLVVSTMICVFFPFVFLKSSRSRRLCPTCLGQGFVPAVPPAPEVPPAAAAPAPVD